MGTTRRAAAWTTLAALLAVTAACGDDAPAPPPPAAAPAPSGTGPGTPPPGTPPPGPPGTPPPAPGGPGHAVGVRALALARGADRPLPTTLYYPAARPGRGAPPAAGRFPLVLFSHGLRSDPARYAVLLRGLAAAGFAVAAPAYPHTSRRARVFDRADIVSQPADAAYVIARVRRLARTPGDPLAGRVDAGRVAAVGHSAGGYTTTGLFTAGHDPRLRAGVVLAGWRAPDAFAGPPAELLFVHGSRDTVVPVGQGRAAYRQVPWPRRFVLLPGNWHADYLAPGAPGHDRLVAVVTDFLRWALDRDPGARARLDAATATGPADVPAPATGPADAPAAAHPAGGGTARPAR